MALADFKLEDRFALSEGDVAMSGVQALLRVLLDPVSYTHLTLPTIYSV